MSDGDDELFGGDTGLELVDGIWNGFQSMSDYRRRGRGSIFAASESRREKVDVDSRPDLVVFQCAAPD